MVKNLVGTFKKLIIMVENLVTHGGKIRRGGQTVSRGGRKNIRFKQKISCGLVEKLVARSKN